MTDHSETAKRIVAHIDKTWYEAPVGAWEAMIVEALEQARIDGLREAARYLRQQAECWDADARVNPMAATQDEAAEIERMARKAEGALSE